MSLNELTPTEIVTLYLINKERIDRYQEIFDSKKIVDEFMVHENVVMSAHYALSDEKIQEIKDSAHYKFILSLDKKLEPVASMIEDVDPELYKSVIDSLTETI